MPHQRFAPLLCTAALLVCGAFAARADAAPVERTPAAPPPVLVAPTAPFGVTVTSPTTATMTGRDADAGLSADVEVVGGSLDTTTVEFWPQAWRRPAGRR